MTRLTTHDVDSISARLFEYDTELTSKTGHRLRGIACLAAGVPEDEIKNHLKKARIGVIPITVGEGVIAGFCEAIAGIVSHLGCETFITRTPDVAGLVEAYKKNADIIMLADDQQFIALHTKSRHLIENASATAKGFVTGMRLMVGDLNKKNVLVIGCGPVGQSATEALVASGARVSIYDINPARTIDLYGTLKKTLNAEIQILEDFDDALQSHNFILDASPAKDIIQARHITTKTVVSAPGVPIGLDQDARLKIGDRLLHDPLQIGVATMVIDALKIHQQTSKIS